MSVIIIDYGMGNLHSIRRALEECGANVCISDCPDDLKFASKIILPGVGAFADAMNNLNQLGWKHALREAVVQGKPLLGICLGMQLMASQGTEGGNTDGLGLIPGNVEKMQLGELNLRLPHVGWNEVKIKRCGPLLSNLPDQTDFYFVHGYHFVPHQPESILTTTEYGLEFVSAVAKDNVIGVQFHPEKSQRAGFCLLQNFLKYY